METKGEREWRGREKEDGAEGRGLRANDVDEMLLSGEHVTRPRRIEINAFASRIPAPSPFPLLSSLLLPFPLRCPHPPPRRIALHSHDGSSFNPFELYLIDEIVGSPRYIRIHRRYIHSLRAGRRAYDRFNQWFGSTRLKSAQARLRPAFATYVLLYVKLKSIPFGLLTAKLVAGFRASETCETLKSQSARNKVDAEQNRRT